MSLPSEDLHALYHNAERLAQQLPQSASKDEAFELAIQAAETSLRALKLASTKSEKAKCNILAERLMQEAEAIKKSTNWRRALERMSTPCQAPVKPTATVRVLREPTNSRELPKREEIIKLKAGWLNDEKFPVWKESPSPREFELQDGEDLFLDPHSELSLSDFQEGVLDDWKRPIDALPPPSWFSGDRTNLGPVMSVHRDIDLVQDAATDCSVVASLCAGVARFNRGHAKLMHAVLYPYDHENDRPQISKNGKYIARLNFNGCYRRVVIDDRIPTSTTNQVIHVVDRNNPGLLWPALLEKAYLKVRGGYDFPGSNSATDLWILTGWIPEQVFLQDDLDLERFWTRIMNAFSFGDVLITMGTGKMTSATERALGLAGEHDYAVLDLRELDGQRLLLIKNPWVEGTSWRGKYKAQPRSSRLQPGQPADQLISLADDSDPVDSPRDLLNVDDQLTPGTFWMDLDNVLQHFDSIYLNWNTGLFKFRQDMHFEWDLSAPTRPEEAKKTRGPHASLQHSPQFAVTARGNEAIWVLLWRHFQNSVPEHSTPEEIESGRPYIDLNGYITLAAFEAHGQRVMLPEKYIQKGWLIDSPQTLLKLEDCTAGQTYTIVPLEQDLPALKHTFTISAFSTSPFTLKEATPRYSYVNHVPGIWNKETAGGNTQQPTYCNNPQFSIHVAQKTSLSLLLEACRQDLNVNVKLLHSNGQRVFQIRSKDIIVDSKDYRPGCCLAVMEDLDPGKYTIICSTFEPQQLSEFSLRVDSLHPTRTELLPREGAGRVRLELSTVGFKQGESKIVAPMAPRRLVNFYAIARHLDVHGGSNSTTGRSSGSHVRLSIELGRGPHRRILIASNGGEYSDDASAVRTDAIDLGPDLRKSGFRDCWIVLDRMYVSSESQDERFQVELFVDQPNVVDVGVWRSRED